MLAVQPTPVATCSTSSCLEEDETAGQLVSDVAVQSVCFSGHHPLTCHLGIPPTQPVTIAHTYRSLSRIDTTAFCHNILQSKLFGSVIEDADEYADLLDAEVRTGRRRCGQHDSRSLSDEARQAKQLGH